jgi:hypothetical protein
MSSFNVILDDVAPIKKYPYRRKRVPWMTNEVKKLISQRNSIATKIRHGNKDNSLVLQLKLHKKKVKSTLRYEKKKYGHILLSNNRMSDAWKFLREVTFTSTRGEKVYADLRLTNEYFSTVVTSSNNEPLAPIQTCDPMNNFSFHLLSPGDVLNLINSIKVTKSAGCDNLSGALLKLVAPAIAPNVTSIFNQSLTQGCFPKCWKNANITPIWKGKGSKSDPSNYRPISVLPILARLLERTCTDQLDNFCAINKIIPPEQFGFRAHSSCEILLITATDSWMKSIDEGAYVGTLMIDFSKAFDSVPHQRLLSELSSIGCNQTTLDWFYSYLTDRSQRVVKQSELTNWKSITRGVPQGSCLSPILFNIFVRNLPSICDSNTYQFADDITISEAHQSLPIVADKLIASFNNIQRFCTDNELVINTDKTQLIILRNTRKKIPDNFNIQLDNICIKPSSSVKLLGMIIDQHLTYKEHIDSVKKKCKCSLGVIARASSHLPTKLLRMAYVAITRSHLEYSSAAFASAAPTHLKKLDTIQKIASRIILRMPRNSHSAPLQSKLRLDSLSSRRSRHIHNIIQSILTGASHPSLSSLIARLPNGSIADTSKPRTRMGKRRFSVIAQQVFYDRQKSQQ